MVVGNHLDFVLHFFEGVSPKSVKFMFTLLTFILLASVIDFLFGWINAQFNKEVNFKSDKALYGIVKKMMYFIVLVLFMLIAFVIAPNEIAFSSVVGLYLGYLLSELYSVLAHLDIVDDQKEEDLFVDFLGEIFKREGNNDEF